MAVKKKQQSTMQMGKQKLTENFFQTLENHFKTRDSVKITLLPSARENKAEARVIASEIEKKLAKNFTVHLIGYTITVKKWNRTVK